jgi:phosphatidylserine decarboxylase precursor
VVQDVGWFRDWLVGYADVWGEFLDTTGSFDQQILRSFADDSPKYRVQDSMIDGRPNNPSGWLTFNQFFARELNPGLRPVADPATNCTAVAPADCTYKQRYRIGPDSSIPAITIKGTHTYANVKDLLAGSRYADAFADGYFVHFFLGPYSYHRFHTPVAGTVEECYPVQGKVYLKVQLAGDQFQAYDASQGAYEFAQARGILTIDTSTAPGGNVGVVAVIPVGMCQVSGVNMTHVAGTGCLKGDEFGYFTFGGSDIIVLFQAGTDPQFAGKFDQPSPPYSLYGTEIATLTSLG